MLDQRHPLAARLMLRAMVGFALDKARSKRYGHLQLVPAFWPLRDIGLKPQLSVVSKASLTTNATQKTALTRGQSPTKQAPRRVVKLLIQKDKRNGAAGEN